MVPSRPPRAREASACPGEFRLGAHGFLKPCRKVVAVLMSADIPRFFAHRLQGRPSITAEAVTMARALEHLKPADQRVVDDPYAHLFLSRASRTALAAWSGSITGRTLRRLGTAGTTYVPLRHRFIDDHLA